jgi:hypothetical protein
MALGGLKMAFLDTNKSSSPDVSFQEVMCAPLKYISAELPCKQEGREIMQTYQTLAKSSRQQEPEFMASVQRSWSKRIVFL